LIVVGLFGLALGFLINILDPFLYSEKVRLLAPPWIRNTTLSFVTIMSLLVAFAVQPFVGRWSDRTRTRWGRRAPYLIGGIAALSISLSLVVAADSLWLLIVAAMLTAGSSNTVQAVWHALIPDHVPEVQHGRAAGIKTLLELVGAISGVAIVGITIARGQLWTASIMALALFWIVLLITLLTIRKARSQQEDHITPKSNVSLTNLAHIYRLIKAVPGFDWWMVNRILFWSSAIAVRTFILNYMEDVLAIPPGEAQILSSRIFVMLGIGVFILALPAGYLADRIGRQPILMTAGFLAAIGSILLVFTRDVALLYIAGGLIAVGAGIFISSSWALATDLAPQAQAALYLGLANSASVVGSISGRLGGPVIDGVNQITGTVTIGYLVVYGIAAMFFMGSSVVVLKIPTK
jgi:MFS family permease